MYIFRQYILILRVKNVNFSIRYEEKSKCLMKNVKKNSKIIEKNCKFTNNT